MSVQCPLSGAKQTSRHKAATSGFDPKRTFDPLDLCRKRAYALVADIGGKIGNEAARVHHAFWRRGCGGMAARGERATVRQALARGIPRRRFAAGCVGIERLRWI